MAKKKKKWFATFRNHAKSTTTGLIGLGLGAYAIYHNPTLLTDPVAGPAVLTGIANSVGNLVSADGSRVPAVEPQGSNE